MEEKLYEMTKDLPQLIVALDSEGNYIHIKDVKDKKYYCPCCNGLVSPRAYKKDRDYKVQPHFYHLNGSCNKESIAHWIYKNWLFKNGSKFYIKNKLYEVENIEIEKSYNTNFGIYIPDITILTKDKTTFLFEINFTNEKKENDYFCKWKELNYDVVEVNVKDMLFNDFNETISSFELIYSNGICFKKKYSERDEYIRMIDKIKREWSRQDKLNYKIEWERLDWFWIELCRYKNMKSSESDVLNHFKKFSIKEKEEVYDLIKKINCLSIINESMSLIINQEMESYLDNFKNLENEIFNCCLKKESCFIWEVYIECKDRDIKCSNSYKITNRNKILKYSIFSNFFEKSKKFIEENTIKIEQYIGTVKKRKAIEFDFLDKINFNNILKEDFIFSLDIIENNLNFFSVRLSILNTNKDSFIFSQNETFKYGMNYSNEEIIKNINNRTKSSIIHFKRKILVDSIIRSYLEDFNKNNKNKLWKFSIEKNFERTKNGNYHFLGYFFTTRIYKNEDKDISKRATRVSRYEYDIDRFLNKNKEGILLELKNILKNEMRSLFYLCDLKKEDN